MIPTSPPQRISLDCENLTEQFNLQEEIGSEELTSHEMLELAHNHQKFMALLSKLLSLSEECIASNNAQEGIQYLIQGEKILEYAAGCGKNIDRNLILSYIHNEAYGYQRMWELPKCSTYLQAVIYNIYGKFTQITTPVSFHPNFETDGFPFSEIEGEPAFHPNSSEAKILRRMDNNDKMKLCKYHLQYSAVNSQLKNHKKSADSSKSALTLIKQIFNQNRNYAKSSTSLHRCPEHSTLTNLVCRGIADIQLKPVINWYPLYKRLLRFSQVNWEQKCLKNLDASPNNPYIQVYQYLRAFTIGTIMQIKAFSKESQQYETLKFSNEDYTIQSCQVSSFEPSYEKTLEKVLYLCTCLYTYSTELRLSIRGRNDANRFKQKMKDSEAAKREAEIYHMLGMTIYYLYVPFKVDFITHLQVSYHKNYTEAGSNLFFGEISETALTEEQRFLLNLLDSNCLRNYRYDQQKLDIASQQLSPKKNIMVRKLQSKCKRIIAEKYLDEEKPRDKSSTRNKVKKCITTLNNTHNNQSSEKTLMNRTHLRKGQTSISRGKAKRSGEKSRSKHNGNITTGHQQETLHYYETAREINKNNYQIPYDLISFENQQCENYGITAKFGQPYKKLKSRKSFDKTQTPQKQKKKKISIRQSALNLAAHENRKTPTKVSKSKVSLSNKKSLKNFLNTPKSKKDKQKQKSSKFDYGL